MNLKKNSVAVVAVAAAVISMLIYLRALSCDFVNWDDTDYVLNNLLIRSMDRDFFITIFTTIPHDFYIPLTSLSLAIDYHFWGLDPTGYHLTNILLHSANAGLLVLVADRLMKDSFPLSVETLEGKRSYTMALLLAGLLFAIHPLRVESVVWVTERKDVLNGLFTLCSIFSYLGYVAAMERSEGNSAVYRGYILSFVFFLLSLMSKPSSIVLPFMLLALDWYPLMRFRKGGAASLMLEKLPFIIVSLLIIPATTVKFAELNTFHSMNFFPLTIRLIVSGNALFEYFRLMFFPVGILPFYDLPLAIPKIFIIKTVAVGILLVFFLYRWRQRPWFGATVACFILPLVPILPFLGNGASIALAARYTYLPAIIPSILLAALLTIACHKTASSSGRVGRKAVSAAVILLLLFYAGMTQRLIGVWKNSGTMWSRVIEHQPFDKAYFYRGLFYADEGSYPAAVDDYSACIAIAVSQKIPDIYNLYAFRGEALILAGRYGEALNDFSAAIELFPHKLYFYYRSMALKGLGRNNEAEQDSVRAGRASGKMRWFPQGSATY